MEQTTQPAQPKNSKAGEGFGIAGLVLGIFSVILSFVPCLGMYAVLPSFIGLVFSIISIIQANKVGATKGMAIAGLVCSIVGFSIAKCNTLRTPLYLPHHEGVEKEKPRYF